MSALRRIPQRAHSRLGRVVVVAAATAATRASRSARNDVPDGRTRSASIDETTIRRIERLALVGLEYERSKRILQEAVAFAERLQRARIDDAAVRPMYSTLENEDIRLRDDVALSHGAAGRCEILRNATVLEEEYFVAPLATVRLDAMNLEAMLRIVSPYFLALTERGFAYGPQGKLLLRNLEEHWFSHCVTMPRYNVFPCETPIGDALQLLRDCSLDDDVPFALATLAASKGAAWNESLSNERAGCRVTSHRTAKINVIVDALESKSLLHKKQRERKVWWRKLAQSPSRFVLAEAKKARNLDVTEIQARFPFGSITVETIAHYPGARKLLPQTESSKDNAVDVHMVEHVASLDWGCLALLCDSYMSDKSTRAYIHPKLAPYKTAFRITKQESETDSDVEDLSRFVLYLNNMLRAKGIHTISMNVDRIVEMCLIPFVVSVDKTSLKNGIVHVENRSTTLREAVHITDLAKYVATRTS